MAKNVFISFRYEDGIRYKDYLASLFDLDSDSVDFSEDEDRSMMSEETIRRYLYNKLRRASVTIVLLTPQAVNHHRNHNYKCEDWMYDEIRYSLEDRENNRTNGLVAVYTTDAEHMLIDHLSGNIDGIKSVDNLFRRNMMNVKREFKQDKTSYDTYDRNFDSYCSLVSWQDFIDHMDYYLNLAVFKREHLERYELVKRL